ncbi:uncharacterized protein LOC112555073 isoform X5 [Pomacea canaliculata]|uniref:uncharacterized protein LOC112555073 isoform X5 n=1 Tax=Pomacea canaliculata TaxID=400727 RepID=UPI000D72F1EF|nr:uncharacterized protein LOC112555073 isoform X5 [Pomacea canaliculata]
MSVSLQDLGVREKGGDMYVCESNKCGDTWTVADSSERKKRCQCPYICLYLALFLGAISLSFSVIMHHYTGHEILQLKIQLQQLQENCYVQQQLQDSSRAAAVPDGDGANRGSYVVGSLIREVTVSSSLQQVESGETPVISADVDQETEDDNDSDNDISEASPVIWHRFRRNAEAQAKGRKKPGKKQNGTNGPGKECKKFDKCVPKIEAVHFKSNFWNNRKKSEFGKDGQAVIRNGEEPCVYIPEWQGTACRNRTVRISTSNEALKFFTEAEWMKEFYKDKVRPVDALRDGGFNVTKTGLYLIYSSVRVLFHDLKPRQSQAVVVNGVKLFKCMESVDYIDRDLPPDQNQAKYKSCAMTGVTQLKKGDRLEVQNLYPNTEIDLTDDATYFGAVLLTPTGP